MRSGSRFSEKEDVSSVTLSDEVTARLRRAERELQTLADSVPEMLTRFDANLRHTFANVAAEGGMERPREQLLGKTHREIGLTNERCALWETALRSVFENGTPATFDFPLSSGTTTRDYSVRCIPEQGTDGVVESVLAVAHDRTGERQADQRKDEFLAMLAHELRNPLAPIRSGLQVLAITPAGCPSSAKIREMMDRQLRHMVRLIDDLLDVSRISRGKVELRRDVIDVRTLVESAVEASRPFMDSAQHTLEVDVEKAPLPVLADSTRISQVLTNLLDNAAKYTPQGGLIEVTAGREGDDVLIRVSDNGMGIPKDMVPNVFDMFTQIDRRLERAQRGLGIGLSLAKKLVEMHDGSIDGESAGPGTGSTFTIRLPLAQSDAPISVPTPSPEAATSSRRVLVVDDNTDGAEMLAMFLGLTGNVARTAFDGKSAIAVAREWQPEVVFLDIGLPDTTGYEVARALRDDPALSSAVLVALTGWGSESDKRRADEAGFDAHLTKPVDVAAVKQVLEQFSAGRIAHQP
jgi:signal transduction histidine kinase/ActR/RegA family two-component response regulator